MLEQARLLASTYAKETLIPNTKATDAEINAYVAKHPELDTKQARTKAETCSSARAQAKILPSWLRSSQPIQAARTRAETWAGSGEVKWLLNLIRPRSPCSPDKSATLSRANSVTT